MGFVRVKTILCVAVCILAATAIATTIFAKRSTSAENVTFSKTISAPPVEVQESQKLPDEASSDIQVVLLPLRAEGFEPAEIQLTPGEYLFVVKNRTGLDEINVRLLRENGQQMHAGKAGLRRQDLKHRLHLTPGTYRLTETDHPDWTCTIVVSK